MVKPSHIARSVGGDNLNLFERRTLAALLRSFAPSSTIEKQKLQCKLVKHFPFIIDRSSITSYVSPQNVLLTGGHGLSGQEVAWRRAETPSKFAAFVAKESTKVS